MQTKNDSFVLSTDKYKHVRPDWAFFLYFATMFCLYTHTYIQLAIQLFIIAYVLYSKLRTGVLSLKKDTVRILIFYACWMGLFAILVYLSKYWAYGSVADSKTTLTVFRIFAIGLAMFLYVDSGEKALSILQSMAWAAFVLGVAVLLTSSPSEYFQTSESSGFGYNIGQQRNQVGCITAAMTFACMYLRKYTDFKYGNYLSVFFAIVTLLSGSRGSLIQIVLLFVLYISMDNNLFRMFFKLIVLALVGCIIVLALKNIPILYENIWVRFENLFSTMSGTELNDSSAMGRQFYKEIAFNMFKKKPILGWGVDGFVCYLLDNPEYNGYYIEAVYSHCNFSELSACFGLVGLLIWYVPTYVMFGHSVKSFRKSPFTEMTTYLLLSMVVLDFARIPWETHLSSYIYFVVFLIIFWVNVDIKKEEKNLLANAEVDNK